MINLPLALESAASYAPSGVLELAWLVVVLPFVSAIIIAVFGKTMPMKGAEVGIASLAIAWILAILIAVETFTNPFVAVLERAWKWAPLGNGFQMELGMYVDGLTAMMFLLVTSVSLMVHIYSREYMKGEERFTYFFAMLSLFTFSMLVLVISNNTLQAIVGWELVGLCSFLLIGFYWSEKSNQDAANKAFLVTKFADIGLIVGVIVLSSGMFNTGTDTPFNIQQTIDAAASGEMDRGKIILGCLMIFLGAVGKSGQMPLHVWLPDAMAGPTPVSALIHAATMVTAGVFFVARLYPVFAQELVVMNTIAIVGTITLFLAGFIAIVQDDIKKILAYSTVSQLGYMMAALGVGGYTAGVMHLFTHGFFKALLFLGSGSLIHAVHSNNISEMGGLRKHMPVTFVTFIIGSLALAGFPLTAGFFSKDEILVAGEIWAADNGQFTGTLVLWLGLAASAVTTFYMARSCFLIFWGEYRGPAEHAPAAHATAAHDEHADTEHAAVAGAHDDDASHDDHGHHGVPHESGPQIKLALVFLAVGAMVVGLPGSFLWPSTTTNFETWTATERLEFVQYPWLVGAEEAEHTYAEFLAKHGPDADHADEAADDHAEEAEDESHAIGEADGVSAEAAVLAAESGEGDHGDGEHVGYVLHGPPSFEPVLAGIALLIFLMSVALAWKIYGKGKPEKDPTMHMGGATTLLVNKYYLDDIGYKYIVVPVRDKLAQAASWSSNVVIDGIVKSAGGATRRVAEATYHTLDQKIIDGGVNGAAFSAAWWSERLKRIQSGDVQRYAGALVAGVIVLVLVFAGASG